MTILAWDNTAKILGADRMLSNSGTCTAESVDKIKPCVTNDGHFYLVALSGNWPEVPQFEEWLLSGMDRSYYKKKYTENVACLLISGTTAGAYFFSDRFLLPINESTAKGCGEQAAMAAFAMAGRCPVAVAVSCRVALYCGKGADFFRISEKGKIYRSYLAQEELLFGKLETLDNLVSSRWRKLEKSDCTEIKLRGLL